jgi:hypothetical protein
VSLFTTPANSTPSIRNVPPAPETLLDRYNENLKEFHACEAELADAISNLRQYFATHGRHDKRVAIVDGEVFCKLGALSGEPQLAALESKYNAILRKRSTLLAKHAELSKLAGLSK